MKKIVFFLLLTTVIVFSAEAHKYRNRNAHFSISVQTFYNELSPYGDWIYSPDYGYVWRPYFDYYDNFRPYSSAGHWVNTAYGWNWVSDYEWGWATFHYGRWYFDDYLGWMWIPGYEWAPSWVTWGYYGDYYGWAPMGPNGYANNTGWIAPDPWWTFVPRRHFCSSNWNNYIYDRHVQVNNITYITNVYNYNDNSYNSTTNWYYGPRVSEVERYTNTRVRQMQVVESDRPVNRISGNSRLEVYRPRVEKKEEGRRPENFTRIDDSRRNSSLTTTEARRNDPGASRTRETRIEPRTSTNTSNNRNLNTRIDSRNEVSSANRSTSNTRVEPRNASNSANERNSGTSTQSRSIQLPAERNNNSNVSSTSTRENNRVAEPARQIKTTTPSIRNEAPSSNPSRNSNATRVVTERPTNKPNENATRTSTEVKTERQNTYTPQNHASERVAPLEHKAESANENSRKSTNSSIGSSQQRETRPTNGRR